MLRVGLIGFGYWGTNLARNLAEARGVTLAAIADEHPGRREVARAKYPGVCVVDDAGKLMASPDIDAVVVATPAASHFELAAGAIKSGKDVLVEKPLAVSRPEAETLVELAGREQRILMVDHTYVYSGAVGKIAELIEGGELGSVCYYDSLRINLGLFQHDVSVVWDLAAHDVSVLQFLLHGKVRTVQATGASHFGSTLESVAHITLGLDDGVQAHINVSWIAPVKIRQTIIVGDRKMLVYDDLEPDEKIKVYDRGVVFEPERSALLPEYRAGDMYSPRVDRREALASVCAHFAECVRSRACPRTGGPEGLAVVGVLEAAERSLRQAGERISV